MDTFEKVSIEEINASLDEDEEYTAWLRDLERERISADDTTGVMSVGAAADVH